MASGEGVGETARLFGGAVGDKDGVGVALLVGEADGCGVDDGLTDGVAV